MLTEGIHFTASYETDTFSERIHFHQCEFKKCLRNIFFLIYDTVLNCWVL